MTLSEAADGTVGPVGFTEAQRLHPASPVLGLVTASRQFLVPLVILVVGAARVAAPLVVVGLALVVGLRVLAWSRFTYRLDREVLVIEQGVLQRSRREVPVNRIQQVDVQRRLRHRAIGVAVVRIDTAGGGRGAEVVLEAIDDDRAEALRVALLTRSPEPVDEQGGPATTGAAPEPAGPVPLVKMTTLDLALAGVTGTRLLTAVSLAAAAFGLFLELPRSFTGDLSDRVAASSFAFAIVVALALPGLVVFAVAASVLADHDLTLVRRGDVLHLRRGLLEQREATITLRRIQAVHVNENLVRRWLGVASVQLQSAGSGTEAEGSVTRVTLPLVGRAEVDDLLSQVLPAAADRPALIPAPPAARRRSWVRVALPAVLVLTGAAVATFLASDSALAAVLLILVVPFGAVAELRYRNLGHSATPRVVTASAGALVRHTSLVPVAKTQSTRLRSSPFQRRAGLATLHLDVAGRGAAPAVVDGDARRLTDLRTAALHSAPARADEEVTRRPSAPGTSSAEAVGGNDGPADARLPRLDQ